MTLIAPARLLLPNSVPCGPLRISTRSTSSVPSDMFRTDIGTPSTHRAIVRARRIDRAGAADEDIRAVGRAIAPDVHTRRAAQRLLQRGLAARLDLFAID